MEIQLEAQDSVPQELGIVVAAAAYSFTEALEIMKPTNTGNRGVRLVGPFKLNEEEKNSLKLMPEAFSLNNTIQMLRFETVNVDDALVAETLLAGFRKDKVTSIGFLRCETVSNQRLMESICEGLKERSTAFEIWLYQCSSEFVKPILEASYLKCFSLQLGYMDCTGIGRAIKNMIFKGNFYYISLIAVKGLTADFFLQLGRCLIPNLTKLNLDLTKVPSSSLKQLIGSLKMILDSGRSNVFEELDLGSQVLGSRLSFACFQLLRSDLIAEFRLRVKEDISRAVVKSISSTVAKTKNLKYLQTGYNFSSATKFNNFTLQEARKSFVPPFGVNPTVPFINHFSSQIQFFSFSIVSTNSKFL